MRYEVLGTTGIEVSRLCLGSMMFGRLGNRDHEDCLRIIHHALDAGINFIDTADVYSAGESEEIVGEALRGRRDDIIVATKSYFSVQDGPVSRPRLNSSGSSRRHIVRACEDSLQRLGTDCIDLYQVHRIDYATDIDDTLRGAVRSNASRQDPGDRHVLLHRGQDRRSPVDLRAAQPRTVCLRAAAILDVRSGDRAGSAVDLSALRYGRNRVEPTERGLAQRG